MACKWEVMREVRQAANQKLLQEKPEARRVGVESRVMVPKGVHILTPGIQEYGRLHDKVELKLLIS